MKKLKALLHRENGQSLVEMALVLPFVLVLLCGVLDFGWIYSSTYKVEYATGIGARYAAMHASEAGAATLSSGVSAKVNETLGKLADHATITVTKERDKVTVKVACPVKTLTFVANVLWGNYYPASCTVTAAY